MKEARQDAGGGVKPRQIGSLVAITEMTGEGEVRLVVTPVMLLRHDVLDVKCRER